MIQKSAVRIKTIDKLIDRRRGKENENPVVKVKWNN